MLGGSRTDALVPQHQGSARARSGRGHHQGVLIVHATRAFRDRVPGPAAANDDISTTTLGPWYATLLRRRPPLALLVNQTTLLPLLTPLAPAATLLTRIPAAVADLLLAHHLPAQLIAAEHAAMAEVHLAPTANRSVVGILNEFAYLTNVHQPDPKGLLDLSVRLATTPLGPLYKRHITPDRELAALIAVQRPHHHLEHEDHQGGAPAP